MVGPWHHVLIDSGTIKADTMEQPIYHKRVVSKFQTNMNKHNTLTFSEQCGIDLLLVSNFTQAIHYLTVDKTQCVAPD